MVDERDRAGRSRLHYAVADDQLDALSELIREGADVNARDDEGWAPLHVAAHMGNLEIAQVLIRAGADVKAVDDRGEEPLFKAAARSKRRSARAVAELLLDNGADPYLVASNGLSPARFVADLMDDSPIKSLFVQRGIRFP